MIISMMAEKDFVQYLNNGNFELPMQGQGVEFTLETTYAKEFLHFLTVKNASSFYFVSFLDISKIVPITNAEEDKKYLDDSLESESELLDALGETDWIYYHAIFSPNSNMASMGGAFVLNVELEKMKTWLDKFNIHWYIWGESNSLAKFYTF